MSHSVSAQTLQEMMVYYRERAREYDQWFYRQERFDRGAENNARWFAEAEIPQSIHPSHQERIQLAFRFLRGEIQAQFD